MNILMHEYVCNYENYTSLFQGYVNKRFQDTKSLFWFNTTVMSLSIMKQISAILKNNCAL